MDGILRPYRFFYWSKEKKYEKEINSFSETLKKMEESK